MSYTFEKIISSYLLTKKALTNIEKTKIQHRIQVKSSNLIQEKFPNKIKYYKQYDAVITRRSEVY